MMQVCIFFLKQNNLEIVTPVEQILVGFDSLAITTTQKIYNFIMYKPEDLQYNQNFRRSNCERTSFKYSIH